MLRSGQTKLVENLANPMSAMPGFEAMKAQQEAFMKAMTGGWPGAAPAKEDAKPEPASNSEDLDEIKQQLADLQSKLSKLGQ